MKKKIFLNLICNLSVVFLLLNNEVQIFGQNIQGVGVPIDFNDGNEYDPAFSNDGKLLAFVSDKSGRFQLYLSKNIGNNSWSEPESLVEINDFNGSKGNIRYPAFNYDGSILYYSADFYKDTSDMDIFYSKFINGTFTSPISIGSPINTLSYDGQPSISADDKTIYFVRDNSENKNVAGDCKKIVSSQKSLSGEWSEPAILPIPVNVNCEQTPKIGLDNKTLYFSSSREGGIGGYDVYRAILIAKNVWLPAESMDALNTANNDFAPSFFFDSEIAFNSVEISEKQNIGSSIFKSVILPQFLTGKNIRVSGKIVELSTLNPIDAELNIYDPVTSKIISKYSNNPETGEYQLYLPNESNYQLEFTKKGYSHSFLNLNTANLKKNEEIVKDIKLYKNVSLILNVFDDKIFKPVNAEIEIRDSNNGILYNKFEQLNDGRYQISLPLGDEYQFNIVTAYFEPYIFSFDLRGIVQFDEFEKDAELKVKKVDFEISVSDEENLLGLPVELVITNLETNEVIKTNANPNSDGKYIVKLRDGNCYNVSISPKGYSFFNTIINLKKKNAPKKLDVKLKQLKEETKLTLNNITFELNSADIKESSFSELDRVVKMMTDNPTLIIEIAVHTDNSGSDAYNLRLSKRRANSIISYLHEKKIPTVNMISQGYGESLPLFPNDTDDNKALNRRVELRIVKI